MRRVNGWQVVVCHDPRLVEVTAADNGQTNIVRAAHDTTGYKSSDYPHLRTNLAHRRRMISTQEVWA